LSGPLSQQVELIACSTCGSSERDASGRTRGEQLLAQLKSAAGAHPAAVTLASLRAPGRVSYVLGDLDETEQTARGLLDFARLYGQSSDGAVPFKQWPDAVRGHFVCRLPGLPTPASTQPLDAAKDSA
jgi:predicted metal-binding protein